MFSIPDFIGMGLNFTLDGFRIVYCLIAAFMWALTGLFSIEYFSHYKNKKRYHIFSIITFLATEGVFLSADFYTLFVFFEIMSLASYTWVAYDEKKDSLRAADTYMAVAVIGGLVMLMGIFLLYSVTGTLNFNELKYAFADIYANSLDPANQANVHKMWAAGICMLFGFFAKAGAFPLHIWLPKAHPVAPAPASALLSGILTKAGMFGVLILSCRVFLENDIYGTAILIIGVITMLHGAVLAVFSVDLKRTLACSSVSQIGFILVGVGTSVLLAEENALAIRGALMHMANHSLIKLCLFMAAGVVFMNVHKLDLNDIRGFGRKKPLLAYIFLMGALGIGGMPLFNGYISKTLIHESIVEYTELIEHVKMRTLISPGGMKLIEGLFLFSGGLTVAYMTKLFVCIFVEKNENDDIQKKYDDLKGKYMSKISAFSLTLAATVLPVLGFLPDYTLGKMGEMSADFLNSSELEAIHWFSLQNIKGASISIVTGVVVYVLFIRVLLMSKTPVTELGIESLEDSITGKLKAEAEKVKVKRYINRWNKYIDLENVIYRPILLSFLPFVFGVICRFLDSLVDWFVVFLRKTIYKDSKIPQELEEGNTFTHIIGSILNKIQDIRNLTIGRSKGMGGIQFEDYEHKMALSYERVDESFRIVTRSMSFGLILFCIGLLLTVAYIIIAR